MGKPHSSEPRLESYVSQLLSESEITDRGDAWLLDGPGTVYLDPLSDFEGREVPDVPFSSPAPKGGGKSPVAPTSLMQFPFPGMVYDTSTGVLRWERPGDHLLYRPVWMWGIDQRLMTALSYSLRHVDKATREQLVQLFSGDNIKFLSGVLALWAASHFFGVGEAVDVGLLVVGFAAGGMQMTVVASNLWDFVENATNARSSEDLDRAGQIMAQVIATVGVDVILGVFLKQAKVPRRMASMSKRIENAGLPGLNRTLGEVDIHSFTLDDLHADLHFRQGGKRMQDIVIVPPDKVASPAALRKASRSSGMTCGAVAQVQMACLLEPELLIELRHAKEARKLRLLGHPGKPEWMKNNTITPLDKRLGAPPGSENKVGYWKPTLPKDATGAERQRFKFREEQWNDPKLQKEFKARVKAGEIRIENKIVIDARSERAFTGDYDLYAIRDARNGRLVPETDPLHQKVLEMLGFPHVELQHGGLAHWTTANPSLVQKRQALIQSHFYDSPLIQFRGDGSIWYVGADPIDL